MGPIIGVAAIGFLLALSSIDDWRKEWWLIIPRGIFGIFIGGLIGLLLSLIFSGIPPTEYQLSQEIQLVSLKDEGNIVSGSFFLGCGSVETIPCYFYYTPVGHDIYQMKSVKVTDRVFICEEDRTDGVLKIYAPKFINKAYRWLSDDSFLEGQERYEFHIPKGSIMQKFSL